MTNITTGKEIIKDYERKYGSMNNLKEIIKSDPENMKTNFDLEEWEYYLKHPDEKVKDGKTIYRDYNSITMLELELMNFIKHENPKSINELAKMIKKIKALFQEKLVIWKKKGLLT